MYQYDDYDRRIITERAHQFRGQVARRLSGEISEEEFKPLRLQNGLYMQRHAYMLRVAVPYGLLASKQLRMFAHIARKHDRGYGHFTTRQNIQYNWITLEETPDILSELASVEMHAVQTSGNCVRNITSDEYAGVAADEIIDPRPYAEILRQWSTFHPEFAYLPRKFKIAFNAAAEDRTVLRIHDIGIELVRNAAGELGMRFYAGGGMGRTPILAPVIREFVPWRHMLTYTESILRVYNRYGRRDNIWKARIKILVKSLGVEEFARRVDEDWATLQDSPNVITDAEFERVARHFEPPPYEPLAELDAQYEQKLAANRAFARWAERNVHAHRRAGY